MSEVPLTTLSGVWSAGCLSPRCHPGGIPGANLKLISHRCYLFEVAFVWELTEETIDFHLGCLQGGYNAERRLAGRVPFTPMPCAPMSAMSYATVLNLRTTT